jgi:hypothetical protein
METLGLSFQSQADKVMHVIPIIRIFIVITYQMYCTCYTQHVQVGQELVIVDHVW